MANILIAHNTDSGEQWPLAVINGDIVAAIESAKAFFARIALLPVVEWQLAVSESVYTDMLVGPFITAETNFEFTYITLPQITFPVALPPVRLYAYNTNISDVTEFAYEWGDPVADDLANVAYSVFTTNYTPVKAEYVVGFIKVTAANGVADYYTPAELGYSND